MGKFVTDQSTNGEYIVDSSYKSKRVTFCTLMSLFLPTKGDALGMVQPSTYGGYIVDNRYSSKTATYCMTMSLLLSTKWENL